MKNARREGSACLGPFENLEHVLGVTATTGGNHWNIQFFANVDHKYFDCGIHLFLTKKI